MCFMLFFLGFDLMIYFHLPAAKIPLKQLQKHFIGANLKFMCFTFQIAKLSECMHVYVNVNVSFCMCICIPVVLL